MTSIDSPECKHGRAVLNPEPCKECTIEALAAQIGIMREALETAADVLETDFDKSQKIEDMYGIIYEALRTPPPAALEAMRREIVEACCIAVHKRCFCNTGCEDCGSIGDAIRSQVLAPKAPDNA